MGEKTLSECSDDELFQELERRREDARRRAERFNVLSARSPEKSIAKIAYWKNWHEYKANHPGATLAEFQTKRSAKGKLDRVLQGNTDRI